VREEQRPGEVEQLWLLLAVAIGGLVVMKPLYDLVKNQVRSSVGARTLYRSDW
jgi:hypothetical protein